MLLSSALPIGFLSTFSLFSISKFFGAKKILKISIEKFQPPREKKNWKNSSRCREGKILEKLQPPPPREKKN
jgi:hypothetical protein